MYKRHDDFLQIFKRILPAKQSSTEYNFEFSYGNYYADNMWLNFSLPKEFASMVDSDTINIIRDQIMNRIIRITPGYKRINIVSVDIDIPSYTISGDFIRAYSEVQSVQKKSGLSEQSNTF
jgi:hypothetical protein